MANLTPQQRQAKYNEAQRLSRQGYTRRQINVRLREIFGEGIRPAKYTPIYRERVATTEKRLEKKPAPKRKAEIQPKPERLESKRRSTILVPHYSRPSKTMVSRFFRRLREAGFTQAEAIPMEAYWKKYRSSVSGRREYVPVILEMLANRKAMKEAHLIEARAKGWGAAKSNAEFVKKIKSLYSDLEKLGLRAKPFVDRVWVKAKGNRPGHWRYYTPKTINVWALKEATLRDLPAEMKWDTPRHWAIQQPVAAFKAARRYELKRLQDEIKSYQDLVARRGDPTGNLSWTIKDLKVKLARGEY